jgi:hypothetical protein
MLAQEPFSAAPGETVTVRLALPIGTRNQVERIGRMAVFATVALGADEAVRGEDLVLTTDPRTARLRDAGREVKVKGAKAILRLACATSHAGPCRGTVSFGKRSSARFTVKAGRTAKVRVPLNKAARRAARRGNQMSVLVSTRVAGGDPLAKRLTVTLRAKEARR